MDTVLGIYAYLDDTGADTGGTLVRFARGKSRAVITVITDGDVGGPNQDLHQQMEELRCGEQYRACERPSVTEFVFFDDYPNSMVTPFHGLMYDIVTLVRRVKPDLILNLSPEYNWSPICVSHPGHRAVSATVMDVAYPAARNSFAFPGLLDEGLDPHVVEKMWF